MQRKVLILGAYGNFGRRIAAALAKANIAIVISGRNEAKLSALTRQLNSQYQNTHVEQAIVEGDTDKMHRNGAMPCVGLITLDEYLNELKEFDIEVYETIQSIEKK